MRGEVMEEPGSRHYAYARYHLRSAVLTAARGGTLTPAWRDNLTVDLIHQGETGGGPAWVKFFEATTGRSYAAETARNNDAEALALREVVSTGVADWEPYATRGDWRRALDAWYRTSVELQDQWETAQLRHRKVIADRLRRSDQDELRRKLLETADEHRWVAHTQTHSRAEIRLLELEAHSPHDRFHHRCVRDKLGALYRAGLAAGGEDCDWRGWYLARVAQWDVTGHDATMGTPAAPPIIDAWAGQRAQLKEQLLADLEARRIATWVEQLPEYWTSPIGNEPLTSTY